MADFLKAYDKTMGNEGKYDNDPTDAGGETYRGIARNYHPSWNGWGKIDAYKKKPNFPLNIEDSLLENEVQNFYKANFWDIFLGDSIPIQEVANELFDTSVNMNHIRAITFLQKSLNALNRNQSMFPDLVEDGELGNITLNALSLLPKKDIQILLTMINVLQGNHYFEYMRKSPIQEKYARGWFSRVQLCK